MRCLATMFLLTLEVLVVVGGKEGVTPETVMLEAVVEVAVQVQRPAGQ